MTKYTSNAFHQPKGDHNRRLSLGLDADQLAQEAGISPTQLQDYERTAPDHDFDLEVARRVSEALDRLEQSLPNLQTGRSDSEGHDAPRPGNASNSRLPPEELTAQILEGASIYDTSKRELGKVSHVHESGTAAEVIVDVGGFLGLGAKPVAIPVSRLDFMRDENGHVYATSQWSADELKALPEHRHS